MNLCSVFRTTTNFTTTKTSTKRNESVLYVLPDGGTVTPGTSGGVLATGGTTFWHVQHSSVSES